MSAECDTKSIFKGFNKFIFSFRFLDWLPYKSEKSQSDHNKKSIDCHTKKEIVFFFFFFDGVQKQARIKEL